jgi:hypothetical protein
VTIKGKTRMRARSGLQDVDRPYVRSGSLGIVCSSSWDGGGIILHFVIVAARNRPATFPDFTIERFPERHLSRWARRVAS